MTNSIDTTIVQQLIARAVRASGDSLEIEYKDGHEEVCAMRGPVGFGIARFPSGSREAAALRRTLYEMAKRRTTITVDEVDYSARVSIYDSFGEDAFRVTFVECAGGLRKGNPPSRSRRAK